MPPIHLADGTEEKWGGDIRMQVFHTKTHCDCNLSSKGTTAAALTQDTRVSHTAQCDSPDTAPVPHHHST